MFTFPIVAVRKVIGAALPMRPPMSSSRLSASSRSVHRSLRATHLNIALTETEIALSLIIR